MLCFLCSNPFDGTNSLIRHLKFVHGLLPGRTLHLKCGQSGCFLVFGSFSGFRKHLNRVHNGQRLVQPLTSTSSQTSSLIHDDLLYSSDLATSSVSNGRDLAISNKNTRDVCSSVVAKLMSTGVGQNATDGFLSSLEEAVSHIQDQVKEVALQCVKPDDKETICKMTAAFHKIENPITSFTSAPKRKSHFKKKWGAVSPIEKVLGVRFDHRRNKKTGTYDQVVVTDKFSYIPILQSLKSIFKNPMIKCMLKSNKGSPDGVYTDLDDGLYVKKHPLFSTEKHALQIQLFYDDFEPCNPLGSKRGVHKLGAIYFTLRNFKPKFNSSLDNIHLCALFYAQDIKKYGFSAILEPLVSDLKVLETDGIEVPLFSDRLRGSVVQITGDNLGLHCLFGFVESFSAHYCCRFCLTERKDFQSIFDEDDSRVILRNKDLHHQHCQAIESNPALPHVYGVKRSCLLDTLQYYDISDNLSVDIMHDILEGVAQYEMKLVLQYLKKDFISSHEIIARIHSFNYGHTENKNKPPGVRLEEGTDLGLNAIQTWCLARNMPLIFGDLVPRGNKFWQVFLLLLQIMDIVFSPFLTDGLTVCLKHLVAEHHRLFKSVFPEKALLPKHHFLIHYPRCIRNLGPVLHMWSMRYESKHSFFKKQKKSFKNITKTLAIKHQNEMAYRIGLACRKTEMGPGKMITLDDSQKDREIALNMNVDVHSPVLSLKWVHVDGIEYRPDLVICESVEMDWPVFCQIKDIIVKDEVFLVCNVLETCYFDEHFHAFKVSVKNEQWKVLNVEKLVYHKPFNLQMTYGTDDSYLFVVPYCVLIQNVK